MKSENLPSKRMILLVFSQSAQMRKGGVDGCLSWVSAAHSPDPHNDPTEAGNLTRLCRCSKVPGPCHLLRTNIGTREMAQGVKGLLCCAVQTREPEPRSPDQRTGAQISRTHKEFRGTRPYLRCWEGEEVDTSSLASHWQVRLAKRQALSSVRDSIEENNSNKCRAREKGTQRQLLTSTHKQAHLYAHRVMFVQVHVCL